jgi:hypothetical protein
MQHEKWNMNCLFPSTTGLAVEFVPVLYIQEHEFSGFELAKYHRIMLLLGSSKI